jgi:holo-[acyl-carrier protein] synthase
MQGIGIDAVDIERFRTALERTPQLRNRLFTADELQSLSAKSDQVSSLAARFAVREATMKALGVGLGAFDLHDVSVTKLTSGQPTLRIEGRAKLLADARGITSWQVSISHTDSVAVAVVAAE